MFINYTIVILSSMLEEYYLSCCSGTGSSSEENEELFLPDESIDIGQGLVKKRMIDRNPCSVTKGYKGMLTTSQDNPKKKKQKKDSNDYLSEFQGKLSEELANQYLKDFQEYESKRKKGFSQCYN